MSGAQLLLRRLLEQAGGVPQSEYVLIKNEGGLDELEDELVMGGVRIAVRRVNTEIGLRHVLWKAQGAPLVVLLSKELTERITQAPDLLRRAKNHRVHALSATDVLEAVLGVRVVGPATANMERLALEHLGELTTLVAQRTVPTVLDSRLLMELLVDVCVGEEVRKQSAAELLAKWVTLPAPPKWDESVITLVAETLPQLFGDEGKLLAWAVGDLSQRPKELVVHGALLTVEEQDIPRAAWGMLWEASTKVPLKDMDRRVLRDVLVRLVEETLDVLGDKAAGLLESADGIGKQVLTPKQMQTSSVLPLAFENKCWQLAEDAANGKGILAEHLERLLAHRGARHRGADLEVLTAIARLSRYVQEPVRPGGSVLERVQRYQQNGAFADLALALLQRGLAKTAQFHAQAKQLADRVREVRDEENRRFAEMLAQGYEAALHAEGVVPLHRVWKRMVTPVWDQDPGAKLYVVVLDGCSYPVFIELLQTLAQDSQFALGVKPDETGRVIGLPGLAPLPTVTSHARGAVFLGELPNDPLVAETVFRDQDEARTDKARFQQNGSLVGRQKKLFLKGDLADGGVALMKALGDTAVDVVAAVFNAVDDQIGSANTGAVVRLLPDHIVAFVPSLKAAVEAGRRILVTADHGHSPFVDKERRVGAGKSPRFMGLADGEVAPDGFLEIDVKGLGGEPERRAFAWKCGVYLGSPQVGFHGGCALEEMVVPLVWLERDGLFFDEPLWWYGLGAVPAPAQTKAVLPPWVTPVPTDPVGGTKQKDKQLPLFEPGVRAELLPISAEVLAGLVDDEKRVLVLLWDSGSARAGELAERLGKTPLRLNGLMRKLRLKLFEANLVLFSDEVLPSGEVLYRYQGPDGGGKRT
ncbi:MAG: BREX-2 system phosphatase PglZ [Myxococcales bacterium]|nr:BREX-2 system phosphatase PglZ [Myxococcales bacterium]